VRARCGSSRSSSGWRTAAAPKPTSTLLLDLCEHILGRAFCGLGDGATSPITSSVKFFRAEYLQHLELGHCPFDHEASQLFSTAKASS